VEIFKYHLAFGFAICISGIFLSCGIPDALQGYLFEYSDLSDRPFEVTAEDSAWTESDTVSVLCLGNSLTYGVSGSHVATQVAHPWPSVMADSLNSHSNQVWNVDNAGVSGLTSSGLLKIAFDLVRHQKADLVFIKIGTNDALRDRSLSQYRENLGTLVDSIQKMGAKVILLAPLPTGGRHNRAILEFVKVMRQIADEKGVAFLNLNRKMGAYVEDHNNLDEMIPDDIHLTQKGYILMW
jgi:lysophospholipase L1-like esterase